MIGALADVEVGASGRQTAPQAPRLAHIQPLGRPHDAPDVLAIVLCLCPNHHAA